MFSILKNYLTTNQLVAALLLVGLYFLVGKLRHILVTTKFACALFSIITVFVISFYLLLDYERIRAFLLSLFPEHRQDTVAHFLTQVEIKLGAWFRGQLILSASIGISMWIAYTFI